MKYLWLVLLIGTPLVATAATLPVSTKYELGLTWTAPSSSQDPIAGYDVYREIAGGSFSEIGSTSVSVVSYVDNSQLEFSTSYSYYVTSVDAEGNQSLPSNTASIVIPFVPYTPVLGTIQSL